MASMGGGHLEFNPDPTIRLLRGPGGMVNKSLQAILVAEGLPKHGVKTELQTRLIESEFEYLMAQPHPLLLSMTIYKGYATSQPP